MSTGGAPKAMTDLGDLGDDVQIWATLTRSDVGIWVSSRIRIAGGA